MNDVLQVLHGARQAIDTGYHHDVAFLYDVEQKPKLLPAVHGGARHFLGENRDAAFSIKRRVLNAKVLIGGADASVAVFAIFLDHVPLFVRFDV